MKNALYRAVIIAVLGVTVACGNGTSPTNQPESATSGVRVQLNGGTVGGVMATIVIQNVFDTSQSWLVNCTAKDHLLNGQTFCDEMTILPPGVYEIIVQTQNDCTMTQDHYKVVVQPNVTTEITVNLVCGTETGGLDTIVTESWRPLITDIDFHFLGAEGPANKFVCQGGLPVRVTLTASDKDTACASLTGSWSKDGVTIDPTVLPLPAPILAFEAPVGCAFTEVIDPTAAVGDYNLDFTVSDGTSSSTLAYPIHIINCSPTPP